MAIKPARGADISHQERRAKVKPLPTPRLEPRETTDDPVQDSSPAANLSLDDVRSPIQYLSDLSNLLRLEKYQSRKCRQVQHQLHHVQTVSVRTARLIHTARSVQRTLAECIKSEDKHSFVNLFNSLHDALSDCSEGSTAVAENTSADNDSSVHYPATFVDALPSDARTSVLSFLSRIRHDKSFVADRIAGLTHRELISLLPERGQARSADSIFGSSPRTSSRSSRHLGFVADGQTELLSSFECGSPLEALIFSMRGMMEPNLTADHVATDLWASICARLISEQKPGSEKLVPAVIDIWAASSPWPGRERLGLWISQVLEHGSFLLEQPNKQSFRLRVQGRQEPTPEDETRQQEFCSSTVQSLLSHLGDPNGPSLIPEGALRLCRAICRKLERFPGHQLAFPNFVLTRWLFSLFLPDAIVLPEASSVDNFERIID